MFVSILVPAFNEQGNILPTAERIMSALAAQNIQGEILFIDDGSRDETFAEMQRAAQRYACVRVARHAHNRGLSYALSTGFEAMTGEVALFLPADLQFAPEQVIPKLLGKIAEGYDVAVGYKTTAETGWRALGSRASNWMMRVLFAVPVHHLNSVRAFRAEVVQNLELRSEWHALMIPIIAAQGWRIGEVPVTVYPRARGVSKFNPRSFVYAFFDLIAVKFLLTFSERPMMLFGTLGLALFAISLACGVYVVLDWFARGFGFLRPLSAIGGIAFLAGLFLFLVGFLAELVVTLQQSIRGQGQRLREIEKKIAAQEKKSALN